MSKRVARMNVITAYQGTVIVSLQGNVSSYSHIYQQQKILSLAHFPTSPSLLVRLVLDAGSVLREHISFQRWPVCFSSGSLQPKLANSLP